ncbi:hypothetical protein Misp01_02860 [Microtetraspora sp. NBRC 13810]|nr:hypothetical protein Misp01_02860 [Microtetraspora sp. NBRC 13810]
MQRAAWGGVGVVGVAVAVVLGLEVRYADEVNPWRRTISEHGLGPDGWLFGAAVGLVAAGSAVIAVSLVRRRIAAAFSVGTLALVTWCVGLAVVAVFPKHDWSVGPSLGGTIHRVGSVMAFVSLPIAALLISRRAWRLPLGRVVAWLGLGSSLWVVGITGVMAVASWQGLPWWRAMPLGLVERGLVVTEIVTLLALGVWAAARPAPRAAPEAVGVPGGQGATSRS